MRAIPETMVHIPPLEEEPRSRPSWIGSSLLLLALGALALLISQTIPRHPAFQWSQIEGPPGPVNVDSLAAVDDRFVLLSGVSKDGVSIWWSDGASSWRSQNLDDSPSQLSSGNGRLAAYRVNRGTIMRPLAEGWVSESSFQLPEETRSRQASGRPGFFVSPHGVLEMSLYGDVWWSTDGNRFVQVIADPMWGQGVERPFASSCRPPSRSSPDVPPLVHAEGSFFALASTHRSEPFGIWPVCEPLLWMSEDGITWSSSTTSLTGHGTYVYDLAWRGGSFVAVGGRGVGDPFLWVSEDGVAWIEVSLNADAALDLYRVESGPAGWIILGRESFTSRPVGFTSVDGTCWDSLEDPVSGSDAVVTDEGILLVDRTDLSHMWLATPSGFSGACR